MILSVDELRDFRDSGLSDESLQMLLDAAEELIVARAGAPGDRTEIINGGGRFLPIASPISTVTSVTELIGTTSYTLASDDYLIRTGSLLLERLQYGTNPSFCWRGRTTVVYQPASDDATRRQVQLELCQLALEYQPGVTSEQIGQWTQTLASNSVWNNSIEREAILSRLNASLGMVVV